MSIEARVIFPISRVFFCVIALILLIAVVVLTILTASHYTTTSFDARVSVNPQEVTRALDPFGESLSPSDHTSDPFDESLPPSDLFAQNAGVSQETGRRLFSLVPRDYHNSETAETLAVMVDEAVANGDTPEAYVENLVEVLGQVKNPKDKGKAVDIYHEKRLVLLEREAQERAAAQSRMRIYLISAITTFVCFLQAGLLLALLAIERNTRALQFQANR